MESKIEEVRKQLKLCRKTVERLTKDKRLLLDEIATIDPNNKMLEDMSED